MTTPAKRFIDMLPGVFRAADEEWWKAKTRGGESSTAGADGREWQGTLKNYLSIFEEIITGLKDKALLDGCGISQSMEALPSYFNPDTTPADFLDWFSSWVGLVLKEDWEEDKKRKAIARIIPIYRMRGTRRGLEEYLNIYTNGGVTINDDVGLLQVGINSSVGIGTALDLTNFFIVEVRLSAAEQTPDAMKSKQLMIETIIEREKPVHTRYKLIWTNVQSLQVEIHSQVEMDTMVWSYQ